MSDHTSDVRDLRNVTEHHLFRGMAIANVLRCLAWQYERQWHIEQPFTLHDLTPMDLRITLEVIGDELEQAQAVISDLAPKAL
jgi:hypothetical protein